MMFFGMVWYYTTIHISFFIHSTRRYVYIYIIGIFVAVRFPSFSFGNIKYVIRGYLCIPI